MNNIFDIIIKKGTVYDGVGSEPYVADIGITGEKIALIEKETDNVSHLQKALGKKTIDATDLIVAPGFIDTHGHSEFSLLADPRAEGKICQGITTEINGNCGLSAAPLFGDALHRREADLDEYDISERWSTFREYFAMLERRIPALNCATLTGHGNLRACAAGYKDRKLTASERTIMHNLLADSLRDGSIGMSSGLIYPPGIYADTEELIELCKIMADANKSCTCVYASHMRSEGDRLIESIAETIKISEESGVRVHISHLKTSGRRNWHKIASALSIIESAIDGGIHLTADTYPYIYASTDLDTVLPSWTYEGGVEEEMRRLQSPEMQFRIKEEILSQHPEPESWEGIVITSVVTEKNKWMEGKHISYIASHSRTDPVETLIRILIDERLRVGALFLSMSEDNLVTILARSYVMIGTDSSARCFGGITRRGKPHPRGFGSLPRFLGKYGSDVTRLGMSEAIKKITSLPAVTFGLVERGIIRQGAYADITIFDPRKIIDKATYDEPFARPEGIISVIVNGTPALWEGEITGMRAGKILRSGR